MRPSNHHLTLRVVRALKVRASNAAVPALPICMRLYRNKQGVTKGKLKGNSESKKSKATPSTKRQKKQARRALRKTRKAVMYWFSGTLSFDVLELASR